jgi:exonuclease SbcD
MRFLHTSDWHLGQTLHGYERSYEHQQFLDWLLDVILSEDADALLISGDIFDNPNPSAAAQRQLYRFLRQAKERAPHLGIVIIAGNHDSAGRLEAPRPLLEAFDACVVGAVQKQAGGEIDVAQLITPLKNRSGAVAAWCLAIPFLRPGDVPSVPDAQDPYSAGIALLYRQALDAALARREAGQAIVALGHCHMIDGKTSDDSERRIVIGGAEALPASMFDSAIAYAALGHLHLPQQVGRHTHIRYCGSPLPMSFAEMHYPHQVVCVDLDAGGMQDARPIRIPRAVELLRVPAQPALVENVLAELAALDLAPLAPERHPYLEVRVRLDQPEPGLRARIEAVLKDKPVRLARIEVSRAGAIDDILPMSADEVRRLQPTDVFQRLFEQKFGGKAPDAQLAAFHELLLATHQGSAG